MNRVLVHDGHQYGMLIGIDPDLSFDGQARVMIQVGNRPHASALGYSKAVSKGWFADASSIPGAKLVRHAPYQSLYEYQHWLRRIHSAADLHGIRAFSSISWEGLEVTPNGWPLERQDDAVLYVGLSQYHLPKWREFQAYVENGTPVPDHLRVESHREWTDLVRTLELRGWDMHDPRDGYATGLVELAECELTEGPIPVEILQLLEQLNS